MRMVMECKRKHTEKAYYYVHYSNIRETPKSSHASDSKVAKAEEEMLQKRPFVVVLPRVSRVYLHAWPVSPTA
jgi:hypothetical protein